MGFAQKAYRVDAPLVKWRDAAALLPSDLTSIALVLWAASRFYCSAMFPFLIWIGALLVWTLVACTIVVATRVIRGIPATAIAVLCYATGLTLVAALTKTIASDLSWEQAEAIGIVLTLSLVVVRWLLVFATGHRGIGVPDGVRMSLVQAVAVYAVHPYVSCAQVGLGDAYHYSLTLADVVSQVRGGVFPVFIGQTLFAFNGGIHTLRTAPYFAHLGVFLDLVTLRTLPPFVLANLAILFSAGMGALSAYSATLLYAPKRPWVALALTALYILSPAILTPLFEGDMMPTFTAVPMIPWLSLGIALAADNPNEWRPWLFQSVAIAALWWAHPPTAVWASALCVGSLLALIACRRLIRVASAYVLLAALMGSILALYEFASVLALKLPPGPDTQLSEAGAVFQNVASGWLASFEPLSPIGANFVGDVQLGYSLLVAVIVGMLVPVRRRSATVILGCILSILVFLVPLPGATKWLWSHVPKAVLDINNVGPRERLYPILAGLAVFGSLAGLSELNIVRRRWSVALALAMCAAVFWSASEARKLFGSAVRDTYSPKESALHFRPENVVLARVSYMFFGFYPEYFSESPTEPFLETRLLDAQTLAVVADGASLLPGSNTPRISSLEFTDSGANTAQIEIPVKSKETAVIRFDFLGREPRGELQLEGRTVKRTYTLPSSGGEKAFGAGARNGRLMAVTNSSDQSEVVKMQFIPDPHFSSWRSSPGTFARIAVEPYENSGHVIELRSLLPFSASVYAERRSILESPRVDVPGYRAYVNGSEVAIVRTGEGLVGVPVPPGRNDVRVIYTGPRILRVTYWLSAVSWLTLGTCVAGLPLVLNSKKFRVVMPMLDALLSRLIFPTLLTVAIGLVLTLSARSFSNWASASGHLRLVVRLPAENAGQIEPLLTCGMTGKGDIIYVTFLGGNHVSLGYDHWGYGGDVSTPIEVDFAQPQTIDISMRSLARTRIWDIGSINAKPIGVHVKWSGREVISTDVDSFPASAVEIGSNSIGASSCGARFKGEILEVDR